MKCKCGLPLNDDTDVRVPDTMLIALECPNRHVTLVTRQPDPDELKTARAWAREHFGFNGA